jgi:hypothetical protein
MMFGQSFTCELHVPCIGTLLVAAHTLVMDVGTADQSRTLHILVRSMLSVVSAAASRVAVPGLAERAHPDIDAAGWRSERRTRR